MNVEYTLCRGMRLSPVSGCVFEKALVVLGQGGHEDDGGNVIETVDPLLTLISLSPDVVHLERRPVNLIPEWGGRFQAFAPNISGDGQSRENVQRSVKVVKSIVPH